MRSWDSQGLGAEAELKELLEFCMHTVECSESHPGQPLSADCVWEATSLQQNRGSPLTKPMWKRIPQFTCLLTATLPLTSGGTTANTAVGCTATFA